MAKKKKKRVFKIRNIMIILFLLFISSVSIYYVIKLPIKNIYVDGNEFIGDDEIISLATINNYPSFVLTLSSKMKRNILSNEYIENVIIKKKLGNVVEIEVFEYRVVALDNDGKVILSNGKKLENKYGIFDVPRLVSAVSDEKLADFALKFSSVDDNILREVSEIEYSPTLVDDDRFLLYMSDGSQVYITLTKIDKLNKYNDIKDELLGKKGIIYLDSGDYVEIKN